MTGDPARRIASTLNRRGLSAPARLLLDAHLPLAPLISDAGAALGPLLRMSGGLVRDVGRLLDEERGMERLVAELDPEVGDAEPR